MEPESGKLKDEKNEERQGKEKLKGRRQLTKHLRFCHSGKRNRMLGDWSRYAGNLHLCSWHWHQKRIEREFKKER